MVPSILSVTPSKIASLGTELVRIVGSGFADSIEVSIGGRSHTVVGVVVGTDDFADVLVGELDQGVYAIRVRNLDAEGAPVAGEVATVEEALTVERPSLAEESDLARIVRTLLRQLKRQVLENVGTAVSVDYDDTQDDGSGVVMMAKLPGVVVSAPDMAPARFYETNAPTEVVTASGEIARVRPNQTHDLVFRVTVGATRTVELINLQQTIVRFCNRNPWLYVDRDPTDPSKGQVRYELDQDGDYMVAVKSSEAVEDIRAFATRLVVRCVDVDEGQSFAKTRPVDELETSVEASVPVVVEDEL